MLAIVEQRLRRLNALGLLEQEEPGVHCRDCIDVALKEVAA
jgi:hypothetical protein